jgi:hypothetical protein
VQVAGAAWRTATRIVTGVGDLMQRTRNGCTGRVLGGRAIERSAGFLVEPQNKGRQFGPNHWDDFLWFGLKTSGDGFFEFGLKTGGSGFTVWA